MVMTSFLGDVFLPEPYTSRLNLKDFVCNLEYPITMSMEGWPDKVNLKAEENHLEETFGQSPIAVSLANNHIMDYGERGLNDTVKHLKNNGIEYFGAGSISDNCRNPLVLDRGNRSVGLLGYVCESTSPVFATEEHPGVCPINVSRIKKDIKTARSRGADQVVIYLHWGAEGVRLPKPDDIATARHLADSGADLILGQHAHRIQPFEVYNDTPIFYGLGNCIMPDLNVRSYYDHKGEPTSRFKKSQSYKNRTSLGVTLDGMTISPFQTQFENETLYRLSDNIAQHQFQQKWVYDRSERLYRAWFRIVYAFIKMRPLVHKFLNNPQRPRLSHLKYISDLVRPKEYD